MQVALFHYQYNKLSKHPLSKLENHQEATLLLCFGNKQILSSPVLFTLLKTEFPSATIAVCSTAGEIFQENVYDETVVITAMHFSSTAIEARSINIADYPNSLSAGNALLAQFAQTPDYLLVLSDGSQVNGSELVKGMNESSGRKFLITGGLAGDGTNFQSTLTGLNDLPEKGKIVGIGFYGSKLTVKHGSRGGWETFGLQKTITRSASNVVYEINGRNALDVYKNYLGPEAASLPGSALLFPLQVILPGESQPVVRTILSIDADAGSMTFAGDIPVGSLVRFMKANFDKITYAASEAATESLISPAQTPDLALLISCVGRKLILQSRVEEEVEAVDEVFNRQTLLAGFYSYGELSPSGDKQDCQLHNQTMTITTFYEAE